jgi:Circularly permutated YpsA SLOG family
MKIISGGQTGADQAALDVAVSLGMSYGGWVPKGGLDEHGPGLLTKYPNMLEAETSDPAERTKRNVRDSDVTIVLVQSKDQKELPGTKLTIETARRLGRPHLAVVVGDLDAATRLSQWLNDRSGKKPIRTINVAGPRESEARGLYAQAKRLLETVLQPVPFGAPNCRESDAAASPSISSQGRQ